MWQLLTSMNSWLVSGLSRTEKYDCSDVFWALICPQESCLEFFPPLKEGFSLMNCGTPRFARDHSDIEDHNFG